jgi:hypothetical protein
MVSSSSNANTLLGVTRAFIDTAEFLFPDEIPMDVSHTLDQLTNRFRSVRDGLPELIKNSKDQYSRLGVLDRDLRQIVVIADTMRRRVGVIDFAGARAEDFDGWTTWSSRTAGRNQLSDDIEAGHGNGGKAFMVRGATHFAFLESCFEGRRTRMGFRNDVSKDHYKPGYVCENGISVNNVMEPELEARFRSFLDEFSLSIERLPVPASAAFRKRSSFTGVLLDRVVEWEGRRKPKIRRLAQEMVPAIIASHGQTAMTIETCEVWVIVDGTIVGQAPIEPISLDPYSGFEEPVEHTIPDLLPDPETGDAIDMVCGMGGPRFLRLCTSARQLQMTEETKARNVIRIWNSRNNVASWPLHSLGVLVTSVSFIYGELRCPALVGDHLADVARLHLSDTPLVRALTAWSRQKVEELAEDLHRAMMAETKPRDREQAKAALRSIRDLMRRYLDPDAVGEDDDEADNRGHGGDAGEDHGRRKKREGIKFGERIDEIQLEQGRQDITMALGTTVPLRVQCKERNENGVSKPVRAHDLVLRTSPKDLAKIAGGSNITATSAGMGEIWLETKDGSVRSNKVELWAVSSQDVHIRVPEEPLLQGQRIKLAITFQTPDGPAEDVLIDGTVDEPGMGILGRHGRFTAGMKEGQATVRVRFGSDPQDQRAETIQVGPQRMPPEHAGQRGSDIPEILLCGEAAPGMEEYSEEQRTLPGGEEFPTIIEDPLFPNVVWINPNSKEATRVRRSRGGPSGVGSIVSKNFMHFVALKCFDVLKRLHVRQALKDRTVTECEFIQLAAFAEIDCADFIDAAWELSDQLVGKVEVGGA